MTPKPRMRDSKSIHEIPSLTARHKSTRFIDFQSDLDIKSNKKLNQNSEINLFPLLKSVPSYSN